MIEDLTMIANLPVVDADAVPTAQVEDPLTTAQSEADKAAASETMPPPKDRDTRPPIEHDSQSDRIARRGQDPPEQEEAGEEDRG